MFELEDLALDTKIVKPSKKNTIGSLRSLNLDSELYNTYTTAKEFLSDIKDDPELNPGQVAQVMNTINTILKEITKMQTDLYDAERLKKLETCMILAIKHAPADVQARFFEEYEQLLGKK